MSHNEKVIYLKDYKASAYSIKTVYLTVDLQEAHTEVESILSIVMNPDYVGSNRESLILDGEGLECLEAWIDHKPVDLSRACREGGLDLGEVPLPCIVKTKVRIDPKKNTALSGLYYTNGNYCTQCEPHGFRHITYYLDRPDVLSVFSTKIIASKKDFPYLLANGNCIESGDLADGRHFAVWHDPFPKPCYLFALVAGDLHQTLDTFVTCSGRVVKLAFYTAAKDASKVNHAIESLKKAMAWDEKTYGLEYDLDIYMVVAVSDFNMGAMENKGLNVFNTKYVLADEQTATDLDYHLIEAVIGHEYFHNWSGNRVTCRDWFQLSLKEGLTVFREQQFSAFCGSSAVQRIDEANDIRTRQFLEDSGSMAHSVRPESYIEINNFYTSTVYEKGAEVIRMLQTLLGDKAFYKGVEGYFKEHDGKAVTCDDFVASMAKAQPFDTTLFKRWYRQAGTPKVLLRWEYHAASQTVTLHATQSCEATPGQTKKEPFMIPIRLAIFESGGQIQDERVWVISEAENTLVLKNIAKDPIPSFFRGFSAPVRYKAPYTLADRLCLLKHESDSFNRWDMIQQLLSDAWLNGVDGLEHDIVVILHDLLCEESVEPALMAQLLSFPSLPYLANQKSPVDIDYLIERKRAFERSFAHFAEKTLSLVYQKVTYTAGDRALKNRCLYYLLQVEEGYRAEQQYRSALNMTERMGALLALNDTHLAMRETLLEDFYQQFKSDDLVMNKWLSLQARADRKDTLSIVQKLSTHPAFSITNPNKVYALLGGFSSNLPAFHAKDGSGYHFMASFIQRLDAINPQVAARMAHAFTDLHRYDVGRQNLMKTCLKGLLETPLSNDVYEIVFKTLNS